MVNALDSGASEPWPGTLYSWARYFTLTVPQYPLRCINSLIGTGKFNAGGNPAMD